MIDEKRSLTSAVTSQSKSKKKALNFDRKTQLRHKYAQPTVITKVCKQVVPLRHTTVHMSNTRGNHRNVFENVKPFRVRSKQKWIPTGRMFMMKDHKWTQEYNHCHSLSNDLLITKRSNTGIMKHCLTMTVPFPNA